MVRLYLLFLLLVPMQALSIEISSPLNVAAATLQINSGTVTYNVEVRGTTEPVDTAYRYNLYVRGNDIYGNNLIIQVAQGTLTVRGPRTTGSTTEPATTDRIQGTWIVPNDGTLHNITSGYRMIAAIYSAGTPFPTTPDDLTANLAVPLQTSDLLEIEVLPDIEIPAVQPIASKTTATATATVAAGIVTAVTVVNPGSGYDANFPPTVTFTLAGAGTDARFLAIVEAETGSITGFHRINGGSGYDPATVPAIDPPPANMTQRTGGILYKAGTYNGGDIARFQASVRNRSGTTGGRQGRPLRTTRGDRHRLNVVLSTDPVYDQNATPADDLPDDEEADAEPTPTPSPTPAPATTDDFLVAYYDLFGDMAADSGAENPSDPFSTIRAVSVYRTPRGFTQAAPPILPTGNLIPPTYGIGNPSRTAATATANAPVGGSVTGFTVTAGGTGYDLENPPAVTISGGGTGASGATATATLTGVVDTIVVNVRGRAYTSAPTVTITPAQATPPTTPAAATANITGIVETISLGGAGTGYTSAPAVSITGGGGTGATAVASVSGNVVTGITITSPGTGYTSAPLVNISGGGGNGATATASITTVVDSVTITNPGAGYTAAPTISFTGGGGSGAAATAYIAGVVNGLTLVNGGTGYTAVPTVTIAPPRVGPRYYQPMPDDGFLDIGEQVQIDFEVLMPKNLAGIYYVAARADSLNNASFLTVDPLLRKTRVSAATARITLLSGPEEITGILSQVTAPDGTGLLQANGASDRGTVDGGGRFAAFQSLASNLAISQTQAAGQTNGGTPLLSDPSPPNTIQQIYRRDLSTKETIVASVSSGGALANGKSQNPALNRAPEDLSLDGKFLAFESEANNLVENDINQSSDVFVRTYKSALRTSLASINEDGIQGNSGSYRPGLSSNGRFVVFESTATNLDLVNPVPSSVTNLGAQIYVHDRDVSNSGIYDTPGNTRTYLVSLNNSGATRATATVSAGQIISGQISAATIISGGDYRADYPPAVVIAPPPGVPGATQATAEAVVTITDTANRTGPVTSIRIINPGAGYNPASPPVVTIAPTALPAGDINGNNGWNNEPAISDDGKYVTWVSYSSNLPVTRGGASVGNNGWRGVVYRIQLQDGIPLTQTIEAVSVNRSTGQLANLLAYEPTINADGSVIAFTTWANNLVPGDSNGVSDIYARDYRSGIDATRRVSESQPRLSLGSIFFASGNDSNNPPNNNPVAPNTDTITLDDGANPPVAFVFGGNVQIGATASATRNNLVRAINNEFRAGRLNIIAGNLPSDRLRSVNTGSNETIENAADLLEFAEPTANTPANLDTFYGLDVAPGPALQPGLLLLHTDADAVSPNRAIGVTSAGPVSSLTDGVTTQFVMPSGYVLRVSGMRLGGRQAELDSGEFDGVPLGSDQPSIDQSGDTVAFRSTMQTLDVFDRTFTDANGIFRGEMLRMLSNFAGNVYVADRNPTTGITDKSTRASVSRFGYTTTRLLNTPSSAASHAPAISGNGRYVSFSSDSDNRGGLIFGRTNLLPYDTNELRDIFLQDRLIATVLPPVVENRRPQAVLTEPFWLSGRSIGAGSIVTAAVLATDEDEELSFDNVRFLIDGAEYAPTGRYGNYFTYSYIALVETPSSAIQARVIDNSGASNDTAFSQEIRFSVGPSSVGPTAITAETPVFTTDPVTNPTGIPTVGFPITLSARVTIPFLNLATDENGQRIPVLNIVRFYANGVLVGEVTVPDGTTGTLVTTTWYPQSSGSVQITAIASTRIGSGTTMTLSSNTLPPFVVAATAGDLVAGSPEAIAVELFQKVMSRAPSAAEQEYYSDNLASGTFTPAQMVAQLITTQEYTNLQNRIFNFYYRLGTAPLPYTYPALLGTVRANTTPLPVTAVDAAVTNPPNPYGSTEGQASAAQQIVSSAGFNAAFPGISSSSNQNFVTWFRGRMAQFGGTNHSWTDTPVWQTLMPGSTAPQGAAVAFMTAYYAAKNSGSAYGLTSAYQFQLYASSLQWLFTGVWSNPTTPTVSTQAELDTFINNLLNRSEGQSTWAWINTFPTLSAGNSIINRILVANGGSGYTSAPVVTITGGGGSGATATASISGVVNSITVVSQGTGYRTAPVVTITGGGGSDATAEARINAGVVTEIVITNRGKGYTGAPTVTISGGDGFGATATATVTTAVVEISVVNTGSGYTSTPTVTITGGGGSGAIATANLQNKREAQAAPAGDGINNLLKYAFNMSPLVAGTQMAVGGTSGTPRGDVVTVNGLDYLQLTYVRRVNAPSVTYQPEFNWALNSGSWIRTTASNPETVTAIGTDGVWERVTVRDLIPTSAANSRFGRLVINASYWTPAQPNPAPDPSPNVP